MLSQTSSQDSSVPRKAILTPEELVNHMEDRGITFTLMTKSDAAKYLRANNNYFRLAAYRKNYDRRQGGKLDGKYVGLDFAMLVELSKLDMYLRDELLLLTLDIEHFAKVKLLSRIENQGEDGYSLVQDFVHQYDHTRQDGSLSNQLADEIQRGADGAYVSDLIDHYPLKRMPVWVLLELISFGRFIHLYRFCADRFSDRSMLREFFLLQTVKDLRNCCAHGNCILNNLRPGSSTRHPDREIEKAVCRTGISKSTRSRKLSNERFRQITTTLFVHSRLCSDGVVNKRGQQLREIVQRMGRNAAWFSGNETIASGYVYFMRLVTAWYPNDPAAVRQTFDSLP